VNTREIDRAAKQRAEQWLAGYPDGRLPANIQRRIRPLLTTRLKKAA
jgi:hypothetical protein